MASEFTTADELLEKTDFEKLKDQKMKLLGMIEDYESSPELAKQETAKEMVGLVNFIDSVQDYAVDVMGKDENKVFNFEEEREGIIERMKNFVKEIILRGDANISEHDSSECLMPDDDFQFNLSGTHYSGYTEEVGEDYLMSNMGNHYAYDNLDMEQLCQLFDHLQEKYKEV
jgi:Na+/phosphate symporter